MTAKVVTDSVSDLPHEIAEELGITVVPLCLRFGDKVYHDGVDLTAEQFYRRLEEDKKNFPVTSLPSPADFADTYDRLAEQTNEILVITVTSKLTATYQVAQQSVGLMKRKCRVEVVDSEWAVMAQGMMVMAAAKAAQAGASLDELVSLTKRNISRVDFRTIFDTLDYLKRGGRIGKAQAFLGSILKINPIITLKDGVVEPAGRTRSRSKAIEQLYDFAMSYSHVDGLAVEDAATPDEAEALVRRLSAKFPRELIYRSKFSPAVGTHTGPHVLSISVMGDKG